MNSRIDHMDRKTKVTPIGVRHVHPLWRRPKNVPRSEVILTVAVFVLAAILMMVARVGTGYKTPDEVWYLQTLTWTPHGITLLGGTGNIALKYVVVRALFQWLHSYGEIAIYCFHIALVAVAIFVSYRPPFVATRMSRYWWFAMFMMPNVLFFTNSVLRDIQLFALVIFLLVLWTKRAARIQLMLCLILLSLLRPELGMTVTASMVIVSIRRQRLRKFAAAAWLLAAVGFMFYLHFGLGWYTERIWRHFAQGRETFGILGFEEEDPNTALLLASNALLFYFPLSSRFFLTSLFGNLLIIPAVVNLFMWGRILVKHGISFCRQDHLANLCMLNILLYLPVAAHEVDYNSAIRHSCFMLPFLYLYHNRCLLRNRVLLWRQANHPLPAQRGPAIANAGAGIEHDAWATSGHAMGGTC